MKKIISIFAISSLLFLACQPAPERPFDLPEKSYEPLKELSIKGGDTISSPVELSGIAPQTWYFEASFSATIYDDDSNLLAEVPVQAQGDWLTEKEIPFNEIVEYDSPKTSNGVIIFKKANPSGAIGNDEKVRVRVKFSDSDDLMKVKVSFLNEKYNKDPNSCEETYSVVRYFPKAFNIPELGVRELLKGPTEEEKALGYTTAIAPGTTLNSFTIEDGVVTLDLNQSPSSQSGGSCLMTAIRAQITDTVTQVGLVDEVVITVNGNSEGVLQP